MAWRFRRQNLQLKFLWQFISFQNIYDVLFINFHQEIISNVEKHTFQGKPRKIYLFRCPNLSIKILD